MWLLGNDNWLKYGWGPNYSNERVYQAPLNIDCSNYDFKLEFDSGLPAATYTIEQIVKKYPPPYYLMCSGGVDSQAMLYAWYLSGVKFKVISIRYYSNEIYFNDYDLVHLEQFCNKINVPVEYLNFDVIKFLETDLVDLAKQTVCDSFQLCTHMKMSELLPTGTTVFAGNFLTNDTIGRGSSVSFTQLSLHRYSLLLESTSRKMVPLFFLHTPELVYSFHKNLGPIQWTKDGFYEYKCNSYRNNGFPIIPQEKKFNGFEKLKEYYDQFYDQVPVKSRLMYSRMTSARAIDLLYRYPLGINMIRYSTNIKFSHREGTDNNE